jgi:hypothetical protein
MRQALPSGEARHEFPIDFCPDDPELPKYGRRTISGPPGQLRVFIRERGISGSDLERKESY